MTKAQKFIAVYEDTKERLKIIYDKLKIRSHDELIKLLLDSYEDKDLKEFQKSSELQKTISELHKNKFLLEEEILILKSNQPSKLINENKFELKNDKSVLE